MLSDWDIEAVATRVAELLSTERTETEFVDAAEIARRFGVSRDFVYAHAEDLGGLRLGGGPNARLRFSPKEVRARLCARAPEQLPEPPKRRRTTGRPDALLPIHGRTKR